MLREHHARDRRAQDQHQQPRIRHVEPEQPLGRRPELIEVQDQVLDDARRRAQRADGDDDVHREQRAASAQQAVGERDDDEQDELLRVDEAHARIDEKIDAMSVATP
jgi:hypothetical protein